VTLLFFAGQLATLDSIPRYWKWCVWHRLGKTLKNFGFLGF
jgi:hypothetical protein